MERLKVRRSGRGNGWRAATALLVLGGVLASVLVARAVARADNDKARLAFHVTSTQIASTLKLAIQHEEDLVLSGSAFVGANPQASEAEFIRWATAVHALERYPELESIGFVVLVPASGLAAFEGRIRSHPMTPADNAFQIFPAGRRSYYCFATIGGVSRPNTFAANLPAGLDVCALDRGLILSRDSGLSNYVPITQGLTSALGVQTPVYRGSVVPVTVAARRKAFVGWLGESIDPNVLLNAALQGHPHTAVSFRYDQAGARATFTSGTVPARAQSASVDLQNGWTVRTYGAGAPAGLFAHRGAVALMFGGALLSIVLGLLALVLATGRKRALLLVAEKTSELSEKNRELSHQALHDTLTGLPNRALVLDRAQQMLARSARQQDTVVGALYIDIDGFKHVNDTLGHAAGDQLLEVVAERLQDVARDQDTVGRLSGDEFVVLVESKADARTFDLLADRLTEVLREPVELADGRMIFSVTVSVGVAVGRYANPEALLRDADLALYAAKAAGKDRYALFDASVHAGPEGRLELEGDLSAAITDGQFFLVYQPIFALPSREVVDVEALIRWRHPQRGIVAPDSFIPLAEESGLIAPIGRWVLDEACRQAAAWDADGLQIGVSVNVSAYQLGRDGFADDVRRALRESRIEPSSLTLEITETTLMRDASAACERLEEIRALGVRIAIDDFGTGYASLSRLKGVPVDILKIDRSFVAALDEGHNRELLEAIVGLGQALSLAVIAEGVEEQGQLRALQAMGCEMAQGFFLAKPCTAGAIERLLGAGAASRAADSAAAA